MPRLPFATRLAISLLLTVALIGAAQYALAARSLTKRVVDQTTNGYAADARVLETLYDAGAAEPWQPVGELLGHIAARPDTRQVAVVDPAGRVVAVGAAHGAAMKGGHGDMGAAMPAGAARSGHGSRAFVEGRSLPLGPRAVVDGVLGTGQRFGGEDPRSSAGDGLYAVPVDVGGRRHVLTVVREPGVVHAQLADMRWILLATLGAGLVLSFPLFYLLGGRALAERHRHAVRTSAEDALTGIGNHRTFHEELRRHVEVAHRRERDLTLILMDLDGFKLVNDTHGHHVGDRVLAHVGAILSDGRAEDRAFRVGGDEFAVLLPDTDAAAAEAAGERLRARIERQVDDVTASIGAAQLGAPARDRETLLACADMALYEAKRAGRNQLCSFGDLDRSPADVLELAVRRVA